MTSWVGANVLRVLLWVFRRKRSLISPSWKSVVAHILLAEGGVKAGRHSDTCFKGYIDGGEPERSFSGDIDYIRRLIRWHVSGCGRGVQSAVPWYRGMGRDGTMLSSGSTRYPASPCWWGRIILTRCPSCFKSCVMRYKVLATPLISGGRFQRDDTNVH